LGRLVAARPHVARMRTEVETPFACNGARIDCEERFNKRGESEVLRHIAGKIANKLNPILSKLKPLSVDEEDHTLKSGDCLGIWCRGHVEIWPRLG
jgi:hypothetical protein